MLQQTQVVTVVPYFEKFIGRFPSVEILAAAPLDDVLLHWAGLGYYSRARNIHKAAQMIVTAGGFPTDREGWLEIPGVGNYTAGAILSISQDRPEAILDGNVERVLSRVRRVNRLQGDSAYKQRLWRLSRAVVERAHRKKIKPSVINQALMELGAMVCTPKSPKCEVCPVRDACRAYQAGVVDQYPPKKAGKKWINVQEELHCVLDEQGRVLLRKRAKGEWRAGLWDLLENAKLTSGLVKIATVESKHIVTRHKIARTTQVWKMPRSGGRESARLLKVAENTAAQSDLIWIPLDEKTPSVALGSALKKTLQLVRERLES